MLRPSNESKVLDTENPPKVRNVFTWNKHGFPDPEEWAAKYHSLGIRLLANMKPFILISHPSYPELNEARDMFSDKARSR